MANELKMAQVNTIQSLLGLGWSHRRIARELGINRETVGRYARRFAESDPKPAISTTGTGDAAGLKPAISTAGRHGACGPYHDHIVGMLEQGLSAVRVHQDLVAQHGFTASYESVKRYVRRLGETTPLPFRRIETAAGEQAQVDFGEGSFVRLPDGRRRRPNLLRVVLSSSRKGYTEATWKQTTESFLRCLENAFWSFGGVPRTLVIDNLRAAVKQPDWFDPELTPKVAAFAKHYGVVILPTKPRMPRHKGKVEAGVKYAQNNGAKGRTFESIEEQNAFWRSWESGVADQRIHGTTRRQVRACFEEQERKELSPLPATRFPCFEEAERKVHRDGHISIENAYYSVPPEYLGRRVWARWDQRLVRIYSTKMELVATHARAIAGKFSTQRAHIHSEKIATVERGVGYLLQKAAKIGPESEAWGEALIRVRGAHAIRVLQGFITLTGKHRAEQIEAVAALAHPHEVFRLRTLKKMLASATPAEEPEYIQSHPIIRDPAVYGAFVAEAVQRTACVDEGESH